MGAYKAQSRGLPEGKGKGIKIKSISFPIVIII